MAFAPNFDKHLKKYLEEHAGKYTWVSGWSAPGTRWKVDVAGFKKNSDVPFILVEVELKRDDPVGNVVKIWRWAHDSKNRHKILFVHAFSKHYWQKKSESAKKVRLRERAIFIGERMMEDLKNIKYKVELMEYRPKMLPGFYTMAGAGRMILAAQILGKKVARIAHSA